jgi:hypothetical protein|tara:strand:+ start:11775 stop:12644 length:870 start_codon:yes stop_codon:yes gene_type:complete
MTQGDNQRNVKRAYRKQAFQTGYSQITDTADATPRPLSSYSTDTTQATVPARPGIDPRTYQKMTRPSVEGLEFTHALDSARYPWNLVPKPDSSNVIARQKFDLTSLAGGGLAQNKYADVLVLNVSGIAGSQSPTGDIPGPQPIPALEAMAIAPASNTTNNGENTRFPNVGGDAGTAVAGTVQRMGSDEIYRIGSFGHTELTGTDKTYQIWVDGRLFMEWSDFQWSPIVPKINQWNFDQPITVTEQIVFRVINQNAVLCTDTIDICFAGWSEQFTGYTDVSYQQLVPTNN